MPTRDELIALRERVRTAAGPDREIDRALWDAFLKEEENDLFYFDNAPFFGVGTNFTDSIDAALAFVERVLPGCAYTLNSFDVQRKPSVVRAVKVHLSDYPGADSGALGEHSCAPLAIIDAALTALIEKDSSNG